MASGGQLSHRVRVSPARVRRLSFRASAARAAKKGRRDGDRAKASKPRQPATLPEPQLGRPGERYDKACYRYRTQVLVGPWRRRPEQALEDAVKAKQAVIDEGGTWHWVVDGEIEESFCDREGACGGEYPER